MTPSVSSPLFFSEDTCSRGEGVSPRIESCHLAVLSVIASGVHRGSPYCKLRQLLVFLFICRFRCVFFVITLISELASCWRFELCTFGNMPIMT